MARLVVHWEYDHDVRAFVAQLRSAYRGTHGAMLEGLSCVHLTARYLLENVSVPIRRVYFMHK